MRSRWGGGFTLLILVNINRLWDYKCTSYIKIKVGWNEGILLNHWTSCHSQNSHFLSFLFCFLWGLTAEQLWAPEVCCGLKGAAVSCRSASDVFNAGVHLSVFHYTELLCWFVVVRFQSRSLSLWKKKEKQHTGQIDFSVEFEHLKISCLLFKYD